MIIGILLILASFIYGFISAYNESMNRDSHSSVVPNATPTQTSTQSASSQPTPTSQTLSDAFLGKPSIDVSALETRIHQLINNQRAAHNLPQLRWDSQLTVIARKHSQDMATRNYFSHDTPEGKGPTERAAVLGYVCEKRIGNYIYGMGENIFQNNLYNSIHYINGIPVSYDWNDLEELASSTVDGWMNSPGHRENILRKTYDREGIGLAISKDDKVYITEDFC